MQPPRTEPLAVARTLPRIRRVAIANERLVANQVLRAALGWALWVIPVAVAGVGGFDAYAASAANRQSDLLDFLGGSHADVAVAGSLAFLLTAIVEAWLIAAFCCSVRDGRTRLFGGTRATARIAAINAASYAAIFASGLANVLLGLVAALAITLATLYAPYAVALGDQGIGEALRTSIRLARRARGTTALIVIVLLLLAQLAYGLIDQPIIDGTGALPLMVLASILAEALVDYLADCAAIAVLIESEGEAFAMAPPL